MSEMLKPEEIAALPEHLQKLLTNLGSQAGEKFIQKLATGESYKLPDGYELFLSMSDAGGITTKVTKHGITLVAGAYLNPTMCEVLQMDTFRECIKSYWDQYSDEIHDRAKAHRAAKGKRGKSSGQDVL